MLESMTAYGSTDVEFCNIKATIEIRSVNHRFFECRAKMPSYMYKVETTIRKILKDKLVRGSLDLFVRSSRSTCQNAETLEALELDDVLLSQYVKILADVKNKYKIDGDLKISDVIRIPNIFMTNEKDLTMDFLDKHLLPAVEKCADSVLEMQKKEGQALKTVINKNLDEVEKNVSFIEKRTGDHFEETYKKALDKLNKILSSVDISKDKIVTEAGLIANRLDISEELDRLKSHIEQFRETEKGSTEPVGKKLDFIIQEINREFNTIASKSESKDIVYIAVESKTLVEKMREQIQNVK